MRLSGSTRGNGDGSFVRAGLLTGVEGLEGVPAVLEIVSVEIILIVLTPVTAGRFGAVGENCVDGSTSLVTGMRVLRAIGPLATELSASFKPSSGKASLFLSAMNALSSTFGVVSAVVSAVGNSEEVVNSGMESVELEDEERSKGTPPSYDIVWFVSGIDSDGCM